MKNKKVNRFRLIIDGKVTLVLTRRNYTTVLAMADIRGHVETMLMEIETKGFGGMMESCGSYQLQVNRV